jgi:hypothetical protein
MPDGGGRMVYDKGMHIPVHGNMEDGMDLEKS